MRSLDAEGFREFVTALWQARGYSVTEEGSLLRVRRDGSVHRIAVVHQPYAFGRVPLSRGAKSLLDGSTST
ncbi:MAG: hypothetical protein ABEH65_10790, partial [Halobacteriales archaeon]